MKALLSVSAALAICLVSHAGGDNAADEKAEMQRTAEKYRKCAVENKAAKLSECEQNAPEATKAASAKTINVRQKIGEIEEKLAAAYDAGDKQLIQQLHEQKNDAEMEYELSEKEKRAAYVISGVDELLKKIPDSEDAKQLKTKTDSDLNAYLGNAKKLIELRKEQMRLEKAMRNIDSNIELIRKREELKKLEKEIDQNK